MGKRRLEDESKREKSLADIIYEYLPKLAKDSPKRFPDGSSELRIVHTDLVLELSISLGISERSVKGALKKLRRNGLLKKMKLDPPDHYWLVIPSQKK